MAITNYFAAEQLLIDRLADQIPDIKVVSTSELQSIEKRLIASPIIHVMYAGDLARSTEVYHDAIYKPQQQWIVVLSVRDVRSVSDGTRASDTAGEALISIITALSGYKLSEDFSPLLLMPGSRPQYQSDFAHYPITFTTRATI